MKIITDWKNFFSFLKNPNYLIAKEGIRSNFF